MTTLSPGLLQGQFSIFNNETTPYGVRQNQRKSVHAQLAGMLDLDRRSEACLTRW